jgi:parvulin-like peptidyl-prolyl isomerase
LVKASKKHSKKHPAHHAKKRPAQPKRARKKKAPVKKYVTGVIVFVVLVAIVYGLIHAVSNFGSQRSGVAAVVNGETITVGYLDEQYSRIPPMYQEFISKEVLLNQSINEVLLMQEAEKEGLTVTAAEVEEEIEKAIALGGLTEEEFEQRMAEQNITRDVLIELYQKQLIINKLLEEKVFTEMDITEADIDEYYNSRIRAMHVLVETEDEAFDIIRQLGRASKNTIETKFGELAAELSIDPSAAANSGDLGEFGRGQMVAPFEEAAFALEEYEYTAAPVQTSFGYHVILRLPKAESLEEQYDSIREILAMQKKADVVPVYIEQLRRDAQITISYSDEE